jgi:hypothetical protein
MSGISSSNTQDQNGVSVISEDLQTLSIPSLQKMLADLIKELLTNVQEQKNNMQRTNSQEMLLASMVKQRQEISQQ